ncbi:MAG: hypothetical protein AAB420_02265 [Patescibacteria group bacterium]
MAVLDSVAKFFQSTLGSISLSTVDHRWLIVAGAVFVIALIVFTQDKARAIKYLILLYALWFVASLVPGVMDKIEKAVPADQLFVIQIIFGALPLVAVIVLKKKHAQRTRQSRYSRE